jgi:hypothetical protein
MAHALGIPEKLLIRCVHWSEGLRARSGNDTQIGYLQRELQDLLLDAELFKEILSNIVEGESYPDIHTNTMFASEIILFRDPVRGFSLRMCLWGPGEYDPIHDHNSWGVIGTVSGCIEVINYQRLDDGSDERCARLEESGRDLLPIGGTYSILPLNHGIHCTGNPYTSTIVQLGVYGKNLTGRNYLNAFDAKTGEISRLYSPQVKKRMLAQQALKSL